MSEVSSTIICLSATCFETFCQTCTPWISEGHAKAFEQARRAFVYAVGQ